MKYIKLGLLLAFTLIICSVQLIAQPTFKTGHDPKPMGKHWVKLEKLSDEFNGSSIDKSKWETSVKTWIGRAPGLFTQEAISVGKGNLRITNSEFPSAKTVKGKTWTHGCGLVTSKESAKVGYYFETRMKASKTFMSSTFWLINVRNEGEDCDKRTTELDINEVVGQITKSSPVNKLNEMGSNTHSRNTSCKHSITGSKGNRVDIGEEAYKDYHIYAAWWKSKSEIQFFLDGKYVYTINPVEDFDLPMFIRMVTETYNWNPVPEDGGMTGSWDERTTFYDWTRTWKLETTPNKKNSIYINNPEPVITGADDFTVNICYKTDAKSEIVLTALKADGSIISSSNKTVKKSSKTVNFSISLTEAWPVGKEYLLKVEIKPLDDDKSNNTVQHSRTFEVKPEPLGSHVTIQNLGNLKYMSSANTNSLSCNKAIVNKAEVFEIVEISDSFVALKGNNGKYVSSKNGKGAMTCISTKISATEKFTLIDHGDNIFTLKGNNNKHVRANMHCDGTGISDWLKFKFSNAL